MMLKTRGHHPMFVAGMIGHMAEIWSCDVLSTSLQSPEYRIQFYVLRTQFLLDLGIQSTPDPW